MSAHEVLGPQLRGLFLTTADTRVGDGALEAVLAQTRTTAQRPAWMVVVRGGSMLGPLRLAGMRKRAAWAGIALLIVLALVAVLLAGRPPATVVPGLLAYSRDGAVYLARPDGTQPVLVAGDAVDLRVRAWSPAGDHVAVQSSEPAVFVIDVASGSVRRIGAGNYVAWAADGGSILVDRWPGGLQFVALDGGVARELGRFELPALSPDGQWLAGERDGNLIVVDLSSGVETKVAVAPHFLSRASDWDHATWSPDSLWLAHIHKQGELIGLSIVKRDGTGLTRIEGTAGTVDRPSWSPDGAWIAYLDMARLTGNEAPSKRLVIIRPDGRDRRVLVDEVGEAVVGETTYGWDRFVWSPDGARIAYFAPDGELEQIELATSVVTRLGPQGAGIGSVAWQRWLSDAPPPQPPVASASSGPTASVIPLNVPAQGPPADPERAWRRLVVSRLITDGGPDDLKCAAESVDVATGDATRISTELPIIRRDSGYSSDSCGPWSPNGTRFVVFRSADSVAVLDQAGAEVGMITGAQTGLTRIASVEWSPAGGWLLVRGCLPSAGTVSPSAPPVVLPGAPGTLDPSCVPARFIARPDGSSLTALVGEPRWSANDSVMAVSAVDGSLLVGPGDGTALTPIGAIPLPADWSPDATRFAYLQAGDLWVATADGRDVRNLTRFAVPGATAAAWSPDGRFIAVIHGGTVWLIPPGGGDRIAIELTTARPGAVRWSPDGRHLGIEAYDGRALTPMLVLVATEGVSAVMVEGVRPIAWSPDSAFLLVGPLEGDGLDVIRADGSGRRVVAGDLANLSVPRWVP